MEVRWIVEGVVQGAESVIRDQVQGLSRGQTAADGH